MIRAHDILALTELLRRTPMTAPEQVFATDLLARLEQLVPTPDEAPADQAAPETDQADPSPPPEREPPLRPGPLAGY